MGIRKNYYSWTVGSRWKQGKFSGSCSGAGSKSRKDALRRIKEDAPGHFVLGPQGYAVIRREDGRGVEHNLTEDVTEEIRRYLCRNNIPSVKTWFCFGMYVPTDELERAQQDYLKEIVWKPNFSIFSSVQGRGRAFLMTDVIFFSTERPVNF